MASATPQPTPPAISTTTHTTMELFLLPEVPELPEPNHETTTLMSKVFDTAELLEMILYKLPTKDLLFAQEVSKGWKATIDGSLKLQQALFFHPIPSEGVTYESATHGISGLDPVAYRRVKERAAGDFLANPLLRRGNWPKHHRYLLLMDAISPNAIRQFGSAFWYEEASWKKMLVTQPPLRNSFYLEDTERRNESLDIHSGDLFRMGDVADFFKHQLHGNERAKFVWPYAGLEVSYAAEPEMDVQMRYARF